MDREPGEQVIFRGHPSWLSGRRLYIRGLVSGLVIGVAAGVASVVASGRMQAAWVVLGVLLTFGLQALRAHLRRTKVTYSLTSRRVTIETGRFSRRLHEARLDHIRTVRARQSVLERVLGIGTVHFDTAGEWDFDFCFRSVEDPRWIARYVDRALQARDDDLLRREVPRELVDAW